MASVAPIPQMTAASDSEADRRPYVIVGNGVVGMRLAQELMERLPQQAVILYGDEPHEPYNRVRLSSWLIGEVDRDSLTQPLRTAAGSRIEERIGYRIVSVDRVGRLVTDNRGNIQPYAKLILATGSSPHVPNIPGVELAGVFTFRDLDDTNRLIARRARSHRTIVLGGGLLGLEAARGMQRGNTRVTVIEHGDRLLGMQLDESGSARLQAQVEALGIQILVGEGVATVVGRERVEAVQLRSGRMIACDTLVLATGIRPNIELARAAQLGFGRGIHVDDRMRTTDPDIYAIGECAEHRGRVYGLVAPGLEQAAVAAADMAQLESRYAGSVAACRLKVVGTQVFSMGPMGAGEPAGFGKRHTYLDESSGVYRKILVHRHRLVGAIGIGDWEETVRLQTMIGRAQRIWPWQILRFVRSGNIWPAEDSQGVAAWPAASVVCQCTGATRGMISEAIALGACDTAGVAKTCGATTVCGSCKPLVDNLLGGSSVQPVPMQGPLLAGAVIALLMVLGIFFAPPIPYADSVQNDWRFDQLWRDGLLKQISGFSLLGLAAAGLLISLRKRSRSLDRLGSFDGWRLVHIGLGVLLMVGLVLHTGLRTGNGLNLLLMITFGLMLLLGAISGGAISLQHRIDAALAQRLRRQSLWLHILLFWPVPALLGWHVFKTYWF